MSISQLISNLFETNSLQFWWYLTRAAGLTGYFLIWLSTAWGLAVGSKIFDRILHRAFTYDFHEWLSWLGLFFVGTHVAVLMLDKYLPYSLWQILIPFLSPYRPIWVGLGVISLYLTLLVTITFYIRQRIGMGAFRKIHYLSFPAYLGATLHGFYAGTDSVLPLTNFLYKGTFLATLFLTIYWLVILVMTRREEAEMKIKMAKQAIRQRQRGHPGGSRARTIS